MRKLNYPSPCDNCPKKENKCHYTTCNPWRTRYFYRQKLINAYAEKVLPAYYASLEKGGDGGGGK